MSASGLAQPTHLIGYDRKEGVQHLIYPAQDQPEQAKALFAELVRPVCRRDESPLSLFPAHRLGGD